jgi:hypothetical protein
MTNLDVRKNDFDGRLKSGYSGLQAYLTGTFWTDLGRRERPSDGGWPRTDGFNRRKYEGLGHEYSADRGRQPRADRCHLPP